MRLSCGTCGAEFEIEAARAANVDSVPCPSCGNDVQIQAASLELAVEDLPLRTELGGETAIGYAETFDLATVPPAPKPAPRSRPNIETSRTSFRVSRTRSAPSSSRSGIGWAVFVTALTVLAFYVVQQRGRPAPPTIANPVVAMAAEWRASGVEAQPLEQAVNAGRRALHGDRASRVRAFEFARRGLVTDPNSVAALALFTEALAFAPSTRSESRVALALQAVAAATGRGVEAKDQATLDVGRAWLLLETGNLDAAREAAQRAAERDPLSREARLVLAATDAEVRPARAIGVLKELVDDPELAGLAIRWLSLALVRSGRVTEGLSRLEAAIIAHPDSDPLQRALYELKFAIGEDDDAAAILEELARTGRASHGDRVRHARYLAREASEPERALEVLKAGLGEDTHGTSSMAAIYAEMVTIASTSERFIPDPRELTAWLESGLALDPDSPVLLYGSSLVDLALQREAQSLDNLEEANGLYPEVPEMAVRLAWRLRTADPAAAREVVDDALSANLNSVGLFTMSAVLAFDEGRKVQAFREIRRALSVDPEVAIERSLARPYPSPRDVYLEIGDRLVEQGKEARNAVTLSGAAAAYYVARDYRRASRALVQALRLDRKEATANVYAGILALRRKQRSAARQAFTAAWERERALPLVQLYYARLHESQGNCTKAEQLYRELLKTNTSSSPAHVGLARCLWSRGSREEALDEARKVLEVSPEDGEALSFLAHLEEEPPRRRRRP